MTISARFINETQGGDLSFEPLEITMVKTTNFFANIAGTETEIITATINDLIAYEDVLAQNKKDNNSYRELFLARIEVLKLGINENVPAGIKESLISELEQNNDLNNIWNILNIYCFEFENAKIDEKINHLGLIYFALADLRLNIKDFY